MDVVRSRPLKGKAQQTPPPLRKHPEQRVCAVLTVDVRLGPWGLLLSHYTCPGITHHLRSDHGGLGYSLSILQSEI